MEKTISWIIANYTLVVAFICVIIVMAQRIIEFVALPTDKRMTQVKVILLEWVRQAELDLGDKTGKFKLAQVYEKFVKAKEANETEELVKLSEKLNTQNRVLEKLTKVINSKVA